MNKQSLSEEELEYLFSGRRKKKKIIILPYIYGFALTVMFASLIFVVLNFGSLKEKITYWYQNEYNTASQTPNVSTVLPTQLKKSVKEVKPPMQEIQDNQLTIQAITVLAPITWNVPNVQKLTAARLQEGLIQIEKTAMPGEVGNLFITGHSSNYPWAKGNYNNIFALLDKLVIGDQIQLKYLNQDYLYKVKEIKVVQPNDTSVLQPTKNSVLTLMTCTPVGTSLRRLIVISEQVYPNPTKNKPSTTKSYQSTPVTGVR